MLEVTEISLYLYDRQRCCVLAAFCLWFTVMLELRRRLVPNGLGCCDASSVITFATYNQSTRFPCSALVVILSSSCFFFNLLKNFHSEPHVVIHLPNARCKSGTWNLKA